MGHLLRCVLQLTIINICLFLANPAEAVDSGPVKVVVGVYVNKFDQISLKDGKIDVDFYIWFRWEGDDLKPHESFDVVNGEITSRDGLNELSLGDTKYACVRVRATLQKVWDIRHFPLDSHEITLEIESTDWELHKLVYVPDLTDSGLNDKAQSAGWQLHPGSPRVGVNHYATNYGDTSLPTGSESIYSRFVYSVRITRPGYLARVSTRIGSWVSLKIDSRA